MQTQVYKVRSENVDFLFEKVAELNKKAAKLGCTPVVVNIDGDEQQTYRNALGIECVRTFKLVSIIGETPKLAGWSLIACIEAQQSGENLISCVPGEVCPAEYRKTDTHCDHCKVNRFRREVFILRHEDGIRHTQVGRTCIKDFLGGLSPDAVLSQAAWCFELDSILAGADSDYYGGGSGGENTFALDEFVKTTAVVIRKYGWVSKTAAMQNDSESTVGKVLYALNPPSVYTRDDWKAFVATLTIDERDIKLASDAIEWAKALPADSGADYLYNLGVAVRLGFVRYKTAGLVASVVSAYQRHLDKQAELLAPKADKPVSVHVGAIGSRIKFGVCEIKSIKFFDGDYGVRSMIRMADQHGNILVWWKSGETDWEQGDRVELTGTVKKHDEFAGVKQTVLSRCNGCILQAD